MPYGFRYVGRLHLQCHLSRLQDRGTTLNCTMSYRSDEAKPSRVLDAFSMNSRWRLTMHFWSRIMIYGVAFKDAADRYPDRKE